MRTLRAAPEVSSLAAAKLKALAHPLRLRIVAVLNIGFANPLNA